MIVMHLVWIIITVRCPLNLVHIGRQPAAGGSGQDTITEIS